MLREKPPIRCGSWTEEHKKDGGSKAGVVDCGRGVRVRIKGCTSFFSLSIGTVDNTFPEHFQHYPQP